ncbi:Na+/H+ antiporter subunit D [Geobacillus stearothermophilus]|nr:Na+/H+ antiporter subunit D [Geobacillus stearothermophilus]
MTNAVIFPIAIPLTTAVLLMFCVKSLRAQKMISLVSAGALIAAGAWLVRLVDHEGMQKLDVGNWPAPFGITLVSDMLSALLVLTTSVIALACLLYSFFTIDSKQASMYYYVFFQFLIVGVNGAFTTGDIFNLFVFYEVMLMSSYALLVHGGTKIQLQETMKYMVINVFSSALFVIAVGYLYAVTGTLNMAHLAVRISGAENTAVLTVICLLFLIVFGLKGALFPFYVWMPGAYSAPPSAVLALFGGLLTKVGVYSILRTFSLIFRQDVGYTHTILAWLAIATVVFGVIGAVAYRDMRQIAIYNIVAAIGVMAFGISLMTEESMEGTIFYLLQDMVMKTALFFIVGAIAYVAGTNQLGRFSGLLGSYPLLGWAVFLSALALSGIPPFSGFIGKALIIRAAFEKGQLLFALVVLLSSLLVLYSVMKIFIQSCWGEARGYEQKRVAPLYVPIVALLSLAVLYGVGAEFVRPYIAQAAATLADPSMYIESVLKE